MPKDVALSFGKRVRDGLPKGKGLSLMSLVLGEAPDLMDSIAKQVESRAAVIRGDKECFRLTDDEVVIRIPALRRPTLAEVQKDWNDICSIESDTSTEKAVTLRLATVLKSTENGNINHAIYELRIAKLRVDGRALGFQHRQWLLANQNRLPEPARYSLGALLWHENHLAFLGIIVACNDGISRAPHASDVGGWWYGDWDDLRAILIRRVHLAVSST